jgi:hypothetical protein
VRQLLPAVEQRSYPPGAVLVRQGEPAEALFVIQSGTCQVGEGRGAAGRRPQLLRFGAPCRRAALAPWWRSTAAARGQPDRLDGLESVAAAVLLPPPGAAGRQPKEGRGRR